MFEERGLSLHPGEVQSEIVDTLGCRLSGTKRCVTLRPARLWRLRLGIRYVLQRGRLTGRALEVILGHCTYCCLLNRNLMSIFNAVYKFIRTHYDARVPLWGSVRSELRAFAGLLPLCRADWDRQWNTLVSASDASLSGFGVCTRHLDREVVATIGRLPERERFRRGCVGGARASALAAAGEELEESDIAAFLRSGWEFNEDFAEVPVSVLKKEEWEVRLHGKWEHPDGILVLEGYALLKSLTRSANTRHGSDTRQLLLADNMPVALSFDRRRSRNYRLLKLIRKFSALCIAQNISCTVRWIPSELNSADEPSRAEECGHGSQDPRAKAPGSWRPEAHAEISENPEAARPGHQGRAKHRACSEGRDGAGNAHFANDVSPWPPDERHRAQAAGRTQGRRRKLVHGNRGLPNRVQEEREGAGPGAAETQKVAKVSRCSLSQCCRRSQLLGISGCYQQGAGLLCERARDVLRLPNSTPAGKNRCGRGYHELPECSFLAGRAASPRRKVSRGLDASIPAIRKARKPEAAQKLAGAEGMETALSRKLQETNAARCLGGNGRRAGAGKTVSHELVPPPGSLELCPPFRAASVHDSLFGAAHSECLGGVGSSSSRPGPGNPDQNRRVRSLRAAGQSVLETMGTRAFRSLEGTASLDAALGLQVRGIPDVLQGGRRQAGTRAQPVPNSTQRAEHRSSQRPAKLVGGAEARRMEGPQVSASIRESRSSFSQLPVPSCSNARPLRSLRSTSRGGAPWAARPSTRAVRRHEGKFFLDLFSGSGGVGRALRQQGFRVYEYDIANGSQYDLTSPKNLHNILTAIRSGQVLGVMLATPCTSFSVARDRTCVIRDALHPWGLPREQLCDTDYKKIQVGNACARASLQIAHACVAYNVPWIIENPHSSKLWWVPEFEALACLPSSQVRIVDFCAYRRPWRKRTRFLFGQVDPQDLDRFLPRRCCEVHGRCSFRSGKHFNLTGSGPNNIPWTLIAQPYPPLLCKDLAHALGARAMLSEHPNMLWG